jgi:hypothetical protein
MKNEGMADSLLMSSDSAENYYASRVWLLAQVVLAVLIFSYAFGMAEKYAPWLGLVFALFAVMQLYFVWRQWRIPLFSLTADALVVRDVRLGLFKLREKRYWFKECLYLDEARLHGMVYLQCGEQRVPLTVGMLSRDDRNNFLARLKAKYAIVSESIHP